MTNRLAMAVALLLALLVQGWGLVTVWQNDSLRTPASKGKKEAGTAILPLGRVSLQPASPGVLSDLNQGYLFNAERGLAAGGGKNGQDQSAGNAAIEKIHYSGAIITATKTKALLSYSLGDQPLSPGGEPGASKQGFLRVAVGDTVNGYKVTEILAEKITFSRDGQQITKLLYDKGKDRGQGATPLANREQARQAPAPPPALQAPGQNAPSVLAPAPGVPAAKVVEPGRSATPRKAVPSPPSDEELRKTPLRKRPEPPPL